jgi:hypothetical protein
VQAVRVAWSSVGTAIAVVASAVALAFSAWPALRPDPGEVLAAKLHVETVEPAVRLDEYLQRTGQRLEQAGQSDLRTRGFVVYLRIRIEGRKRAGLELHQVLYRASTGRRIRDQAVTTDAYFRPETPNDEWIYQVFVIEPPPYDFGVFVRLELFDRESLLAFADTPALQTPR